MPNRHQANVRRQPQSPPLKKDDNRELRIHEKRKMKYSSCALVILGIAFFLGGRRRLRLKKKSLAEKGLNSAHLAARRDDWLSVVAFARRGVDLKRKTQNRGFTVAQVAAARGRIHVLRSLMEAGLLVPNESILKNKVEADQAEAAAVAAASRGRIEALRLLARFGTDLQLPIVWKNSTISSPACAAARAGHFETVASVLYALSGPKILGIAGSHAQGWCAPAWYLVQTAKTLASYSKFNQYQLEKNSSWLHLKHPTNGWNVAHFAVAANNVHILPELPKELLHAPDLDGRTPADLAEYLGYTHCLHILRSTDQCPTSTVDRHTFEFLKHHREFLWRRYLYTALLFGFSFGYLISTSFTQVNHRKESQDQPDLSAVAALRDKRDELEFTVADLDARLAATVALYATAQLQIQTQGKNLNRQLTEATRRADSAEQELERLHTQPLDIDALDCLDVSNLSRSRLTQLETTVPRLQLAITREGIRREMVRATNISNQAASDRLPDGGSAAGGQLTSAIDLATECIVCLNQHRSVAFNCGHLCVCYDCAYDLDECPICRVPIRERRRIFNS